MTVGELLRALARTLPESERPEMVADVDALEVTCAGVTHDSRRVVPGTIFVALRGLKADGIAFVPQAIEAGAVAIVSEHPVSSISRVPWIVVKNARLALALLAAEFFGHPSRQMQV